MKKIVLFVLMTVSTASFAQLKKVEVAEAEVIGKAQQFGAPLEAELTKSGNTYRLRYRDSQYKTLDQYREFSFEDKDNTFNDLYATIEEGFKTMPKEPIMLELPNHYLYLSFEKFLGSAVLVISSTDDKSANANVYLSNQIAKKQIEKLFGKKK